MKQVIFFMSLLAIAGCASKATQGNENAVTIVNGAGGFGDSGASAAEEHCMKYGKVAVFESATGPTPSRRYSYLCK